MSIYYKDEPKSDTAPTKGPTWIPEFNISGFYIACAAFCMGFGLSSGWAAGQRLWGS